MRNNFCTAFAFIDEVPNHEFSSRELAGSRMLPAVKRSEHLAGVLALRRALRVLYPRGASAEIIRQHGAPPQVFINGTALSSVSVSVSHSHGIGFAAAALGTRSIGVDIETRDEFLLARKHFFSEEELARGYETPPVLFWAYKEAILKALHVGLRVHPKRITLLLGDAGELRGASIDNIPLSVNGIRVEQIAGVVSVTAELYGDTASPLFK